MHAWYLDDKIGTDNELMSQMFFYIVSSIDSKSALILIISKFQIFSFISDLSFIEPFGASNAQSEAKNCKRQLLAQGPC
jgi:hypothetical protein